MDMPERLLRETIRAMLVEVAPEDMTVRTTWSDIFGKPMADTLKVIAGEIGKLSSRAQAAASVIFKGAVGLLIPFVELKYEEIFDEESRRQQAIMARYKDVYDQVDEVMKDAWRLPFLIDPATTLAMMVAVRAPRAALAAAWTIAGRDLVSDQMKQRIRIDQELRQLWRQIVEVRHRRSGRILVEAPTPEVVSAFLTNPFVRKLINNSQTAKRMRADGLNLIQSTLDEIIDVTERVLQIDSIDQLEHLTGRTIDTSSAEVSPGESDEIQDSVIRQLKLKVKDEAISKLQRRMSEMGLNASDTDNPIYQLFFRVIKKIANL